MSDTSPMRIAKMLDALTQAASEDTRKMVEVDVADLRLLLSDYKGLSEATLHGECLSLEAERYEARIAEMEAEIDALRDGRLMP